ncbi:MAG: hypothetical protein IPK30_12165 [Cellvibrionales bacterium]|nr:hypothetical protein [Cellvibrionales bacterium]
MNEDIAIALSCYSAMIVTWALAWGGLGVVDHRNKQGGNLFVSHLLGYSLTAAQRLARFVNGALFP